MRGGEGAWEGGAGDGEALVDEDVAEAVEAAEDGGDEDVGAAGGADADGAA